MAKLTNYKGSVDLIAGLRPKNNGTFPLMEAHDIVVGEDGKRLDEKLTELANSSGGSGSANGTFSGSYKDLTDKPTIPTKTSQLTNDSGYVTESRVNTLINQAISGALEGSY